MQKEDFQEIKRLRHDMHVCRDVYDWMNMSNRIREACEEISPVDIRFYDFEEIDCGEDDCPEIEGLDCEKCKGLGEELLYEEKDKVNTIIEEWLGGMEDKYDIENLTPSGWARMVWAERV